MSIKIYRFGFMFILSLMSFCVFGKTTHKLGLPVDTPAITVTNTTTDNSVAGFTVMTLYYNSTCDDSQGDYNVVSPMEHSFTVPSFTLAQNESTTIGQAALFNTIATTYTATRGILPPDTTTFSLTLGIIKSIDFTTGTPIMGDLYVNGTGDHCFVLTCSSANQICSSNNPNVIY